MHQHNNNDSTANSSLLIFLLLTSLLSGKIIVALPFVLSFPAFPTILSSIRPPPHPSQFLALHSSITVLHVVILLTTPPPPLEIFVSSVPDSNTHPFVSSSRDETRPYPPLYTAATSLLCLGTHKNYNDFSLRTTSNFH